MSDLSCLHEFTAVSVVRQGQTMPGLDLGGKIFTD